MEWAWVDNRGSTVKSKPWKDELANQLRAKEETMDLSARCPAMQRDTQIELSPF